MQSKNLVELDEIRAMLLEDLGEGDLTASIIPTDMHASAAVITRESAVLCGQAWFSGVFQVLDTQANIEWDFKDGDSLQPGDRICRVQGKARALLSAERSALNWLQTLSGTATRARIFADAVKGTGARVLDTRKTLPGLRKAQKYAVRCGGCANHRMGLYDGILIKENHILAAGSIGNAVLGARARHPGYSIEVEVENLDEFRQALDVKAEQILLDNFTLNQMREAVEINRSRAKLEASGNVNLENIRDIAQTGVDFISVGSLTKDVRAIDLSMNIDLVT